MNGRTHWIQVATTFPTSLVSQAKLSAVVDRSLSTSYRHRQVAGGQPLLVALNVATQSQALLDARRPFVALGLFSSAQPLRGIRKFKGK